MNTLEDILNEIQSNADSDKISATHAFKCGIADCKVALYYNWYKSEILARAYDCGWYQQNGLTRNSIDDVRIITIND